MTINQGSDIKLTIWKRANSHFGSLLASGWNFIKGSTGTLASLEFLVEFSTFSFLTVSDNFSWVLISSIRNGKRLEFHLAHIEIWQRLQNSFCFWHCRFCGDVDCYKLLCDAHRVTHTYAKSLFLLAMTFTTLWEFLRSLRPSTVLRQIVLGYLIRWPFWNSAFHCMT